MMMKHRAMCAARLAFGLGILLVSCAGVQNREEVSGTARPSHQIEKRPWLPRFIRNPGGSFTIFDLEDLVIPVQSLGADPFSPEKDPFRTYSDSPEDLTYTDIINFYTKIVEENPLDFEAHIVLAGLYINRGRPGDEDLALTYSDRALTLSPGDPMALYVRALAYGTLGEYQNALADLHALTGLITDQNEIVYYIIAVFEYRAGNREGAIRALQKALVINPDFTNARDALSLLHQ
jgi:tetratricopeptide (TPR) repeat protein